MEKNEIEKIKKSLPVWTGGYSKTIPYDFGVRSPMDSRDVLAITPSGIVVSSRYGGLAYPINVNYFDD